MSSPVEIIQAVYAYFYSQVSGVIGETYVQLFIFTAGLSVYSIFVWRFYNSLSKRDLFKLDLEKYNLPAVKHKTLGKMGSSLAYVLKYWIIFPFYIFLWFLILSLFLVVLTEEAMVEQILMISIVIVSSVRIVSYYKEDLSSDLAKLVPFALLGISLVDPNFFSIEITIARLSEIPNMLSSILQFLIFSISLEWILRITHLIKTSISKKASAPA